MTRFATEPDRETDDALSLEPEEICRFCGQVITLDGQSWRDRTDGDCCCGNAETSENENGVHTPAFDPFPDPPSADGLTAEQFGLAVILYLLAGLASDRPVELYGMLDDRSLQLAEHAARIAVSAPEIQPLAVDRISAVRMRIYAVLQVRALDTAIVLNAPAVSQPIGPSDQDGGSSVRSPERPIVPTKPSAAIHF